MSDDDVRDSLERIRQATSPEEFDNFVNLAKFTHAVEKTWDAIGKGEIAIPFLANQACYAGRFVLHLNPGEKEDARKVLQAIKQAAPQADPLEVAELAFCAISLHLEDLGYEDYAEGG